MRYHEVNEIYYSRAMNSTLENRLTKDFQWLIDAVIQNPELDFQTGSNNTDTWFSVYRGTGRILTINEQGNVYADSKYMNLMPDFYHKPDIQGLRTLLDKIHEDHSLDRYYMTNDGKKKEGFYQNLISRRYSLYCRPDDEFIIIDKEFVLGYSSDTVKKEITKPIIEKYDGIIQSLADIHPSFKNIKQPGTECDFVALTKKGDIMLLELKRYEDSRKIYLSPIQASKYDDLTREYANKYFDEFCKGISSMVSQKISMGILRPQWKVPTKLSGIILPAVVVGGNASAEAQKRFMMVRNAVGKDIPLYTCDNEGTLIKRL